MIGVAIFYIPHRLGGWNHIFNAYDAHFKATPPGTASLLTSANQLQYVTLALGSAFAIFLYPHAITGVITTRNRAVVKRSMAALPIYSFVLGLIALFGVMAIAGHIKPLIGPTGKPDTNTIVPNLFQHIFPSWFAGLAFAMIIIGALVPAAFMSIAAANLFTRNIYKEYIRRDATDSEQAMTSKIVSLLVKVGALLFILLLNPQFSIDLQLLGGAIILQTLPSVMIGLYTRWLHRGALLAGWAAGMIVSVWTFYVTANVATKRGPLGRHRVRAQPPGPAHRDGALHRVHRRPRQPRCRLRRHGAAQGVQGARRHRPHRRRRLLHRCRRHQGPRTGRARGRLNRLRTDPGRRGAPMSPVSTGAPLPGGGPWDVAVVGGGNAGLVAALAARRHAGRVLIVERAPAPMRGGNTRHTRNIRCVAPPGG